MEWNAEAGVQTIRRAILERLGSNPATPILLDTVELIDVIHAIPF